MTEDEFVNLPLRLALRVIWAAASSRLRDMPAPEVPRPPRYDGKLGRKGGFVWMSEITLESLEWWHDQKSKGADEGGQYAEQNRKTAAALDKWIEWRRLFPNEIWCGTRGEDRATAAAPSREPQLHAWTNSRSGQGSKTNGKGGASRPNTSKPSEDYDEDSYDD